MTDDRKQTLPCRPQSGKYGIASCLLRQSGLALLLLHLHRLPLFHAYIFRKVIDRAAVGRHGLKPQLISQTAGKEITDSILTVNHKDLVRPSLKGPDPVHQPFIIRMSADSGKPAYTCTHFDLLTKKSYLRCPLDQRPSQRTVGLISHKKHGTFRPPQIMLQMMLDTPRLTHTAGRQDHLRLHVKIDLPGIVTCHGGLQPRKTDGVDSFVYQLHGFLIKIVIHVLHEDTGRFNRQRTVHINLKILMSPDQMTLLDLSDKIEQLLCPAYRKGRDDYISSPVKGFLDDLS